MTYPLVSRRQVAERLRSDPDFVRRCVLLLHGRTVEKTGGFMASHLKKASLMVALLDELTDAALLEEARWVGSYARSLSRILREEQLREDPGLAPKAAVFGVSGCARSVAPSPPGPAVPPPEPERRRPGRPRKKKPEEAPPQRRRRRVAS
jgi:hypothetical protein